jgi:hypothetical protein
MAEYRITGVWKKDGIITHYAVHSRTKNDKGEYMVGKAVKMTKVAAVALLDNTGHTAKTYLWNYNSASWSAGEDVHVVDGTPKFLRTNHDGVRKDNLSHLPNFSYLW